MLLCIFSGTFVELSKVKQCGGRSRRRRPETSKLPSFPQQLGTAAILGRQIAREMDRLRSEKEERSQSRGFASLVNWDYCGMVIWSKRWQLQQFSGGFWQSKWHLWDHLTGDGNGSFSKINNDKPGSAPLVGVPRAIEQGADVSLSSPGHVHHQHPCTSGYSDWEGRNKYVMSWISTMTILSNRSKRPPINIFPKTKKSSFLLLL